MHFFSNIRDFCIDFLFPKSQRTLELERIPAEKLLELLPRADDTGDEKVLALFDYKHPLVKELVWELKYSGNIKIADKLSSVLYDAISNELADLTLFEKWRNPILIPIPISNKRKLERGWNQAELLAKKVMLHDQGKTFRYMDRQLIKHRHTESQTLASSKAERLANLRNSMKVSDKSKIDGACIVLLDDVTTTGSTFSEAKRALALAGARKILCVAIAH